MRTTVSPMDGQVEHHAHLEAGGESENRDDWKDSVMSQNPIITNKGVNINKE